MLGYLLAAMCHAGLQESSSQGQHLQPGLLGRQEGAKDNSWTHMEVVCSGRDAQKRNYVSCQLCSLSILLLLRVSITISSQDPAAMVSDKLETPVPGQWDRPYELHPHQGDSTTVAQHVVWPAKCQPDNLSLTAALPPLSTDVFPGTIYFILPSATICTDQASRSLLPVRVRLSLLSHLCRE